MSIESFIITMYCLVDVELKRIIKKEPLRRRGMTPKLSDSEVITMDIVGEFLGKDCNRGITSTRRLVETVIGQLSEHFHIEKVRAKDLWHLTNRVCRKILSHTVGVIINKLLGNPPLQFERLGIV